MRQSVNLLATSLQPPKEWLPLPHVLIAAGAWTSMLALWGIVALLRAHSADAERAALEIALQQAQAKSAELAVKYRPTEPKPYLQAEVTALEQARSKRAALLTSLQRDAATAGAHGFSSYFAAVADKRIDGLWLTMLAVDRQSGAFDIKGRSLNAADVPVWLHGLQSADAFASGSFQGLTVEGGTERGYPFELKGRLQ